MNFKMRYRTYGLKRGERLKHTDFTVDYGMVVGVLVGVLIGLAIIASIR